MDDKSGNTDRQTEDKRGKLCSPNDPQWIQDISNWVITEVHKKYDQMESTKSLGSYGFCGATIFGTLGVDYLMYNVPNLSVPVKIVGMLLSTLLAGKLISGVVEYAEPKKASLEEKLRKCEYWFKKEYTCPQLDNTNARC